MTGAERERDALLGAGDRHDGRDSEPVHGGRAGVYGVDQDADQAEDKKHDAEEVEPSSEMGRECVRGSDTEKEPNGGKHGGGIADDSGKERDELGVDDLVLHDAFKSVCLTFLLFDLLVLFGVRGEAPAWEYFTAFVVGYGVLFGACCISIRPWSSDDGGVGSTAFVESRAAVAMLGVAAVVLGSTVLLDFAPDVIVVAGVLGGISDGNSVGAIARQRGCSVFGAVWIVLRMGGAASRARWRKP